MQLAEKFVYLESEVTSDVSHNENTGRRILGAVRTHQLLTGNLWTRTEVSWRKKMRII